MSDDPPEFVPPLELKESSDDLRLYVPHPENWQVKLKTDGLRDYCHFKAPGQDFYHLLLQGEIFLEYGNARYCLTCAYRHGVVTDDRLFWQNGVRRKRDPLL
jgi:hypothetical protein